MKIANALSPEAGRALWNTQGQRNRRNKFNAVPTTTEHGRFDSKSEASWVGKLMILQQQGYIGNVVVDKERLRYPLVVGDVHVCTYEADARFQVLKDCELPVKNAGALLKAGASVVLDVKGKRTPEYRIKVKLMLAVEGIRVLEL